MQITTTGQALKLRIARSLVLHIGQCRSVDQIWVQLLNLLLLALIAIVNSLFGGNGAMLLRRLLCPVSFVSFSACHGAPSFILELGCQRPLLRFSDCKLRRIVTVVRRYDVWIGVISKVLLVLLGFKLVGWIGNFIYLGQANNFTLFRVQSGVRVFLVQHSVGTDGVGFDSITGGVRIGRLVIDVNHMLECLLTVGDALAAIFG